MPVRIIDVYGRAAKCLGAQLIILILAACGGSSNSEKIASQSSLRETSSGLPIVTDAYLSTLTQVELPEVDSADASLEFVSAQNSSQPLISDQSAPGRYRLPIVVSPTSGYLNVSMPGRALLSLPVNLVPYQTSDVPGEAVQSFLQSSLRTMNTAIHELATSAFPLPAVMEATSAAAEMSGQLLTWVNEAMQKGSATMVRLQDGTSMKLTVEDLKVLDQLVLAPAMFSVRGDKPKLAGRLSPVEHLFDLLIPSALAETC